MVGIPEWEWYIGAGFDLKELEEQVSKLQAKTQQHVKSVFMIVSIAVVILILVIILTAKTEIRRIRKNYQEFMNFFNSVDLENTAIDTNSMRFMEFEEIASAANKMVANRMQAEEALSESEERLSMHIQNTPVGAISWDFDFLCREWNKAAEDIFGYTHEEAIGRHAAEIIVPSEIRDEINKIYMLLLEQKGGTRSTNENITKDGQTIICDWYNTPIVDVNGEVTGVASLIQDITERKRMEADLQDALVNAERANQAKSEFLASMSHELRTPLNAILGFSDILHNQYFGPPGSGKYREYAADIHHSGEQLLELVNDILDISSIEAGKTSLNKELLSIQAIIDDCNHIVSVKALSKGIELEAIVTNDLPSLYADKRAVKQILLNLLSNSIKFTQNDGKITVNAHAIDTGIRIEVIDNGFGIRPDKLKDVTDPFTKGSNDPHLAEQGWGLGLSITKSLVELHDGVMVIESEVGKGTSVIIDLPSSPEVP